MSKLTKSLSTYDEFIKDEEQRILLHEEYRTQLISELMLRVMSDQNVSVWRLAEEIGISPTIIQELKTGKRSNITLSTFFKIIDALGYQIVLEEKEKPT